jgi:hypothetical protein
MEDYTSAIKTDRYDNKVEFCPPVYPPISPLVFLVARADIPKTETTSNDQIFLSVMVRLSEDVGMLEKTKM